MAIASPLGRLRRSRRLSLLVFAGTLLALVAAAAWFITARTGLAKAYDQLSNRNELLALAKMNQQEAQLKVDNARSARQLMDQLAAMDMQPDVWGERLINLNQTQLSRMEASSLLAGIAPAPERIFGADAFELSVTHVEEGLFHLPSALGDRPPAPLSLTLRGSLLFRTTGPTDAAGIVAHTPHASAQP